MDKKRTQIVSVSFVLIMAMINVPVLGVLAEDVEEDADSADDDSTNDSANDDDLDAGQGPDQGPKDGAGYDAKDDDNDFTHGGISFGCLLLLKILSTIYIKIIAYFCLFVNPMYEMSMKGTVDDIFEHTRSALNCPA
ncbi:MAG: hypothetical protein AAB465_03420, partial [Patescibacteria group bacterium]